MVEKFFREISQIPRPSLYESKIADYLVDFAKERNLKVYRDDLHNVIIYKPASIGYENHETVILQGHTDMVAEKSQDSNHDFLKDPIKIIEKEGYFWADKTTLGADDGVAVAYMLSVLDDDSLKHPPLECVFTVQEEIGLIGAFNLDCSQLSGRRLIGLDTSMEHVTTVSSSGGCRCDITKAFVGVQAMPKSVVVKIRGLSGGHSGESIHEEKGNSLNIAGAVLQHLHQYRLSSITGGLKMNAIARECDIVFGLDSFDEFNGDLVSLLNQQYCEIYAESEPDLTITYELVDQKCQVVSASVQKAVCQLLSLLPYGVKHRSLSIKDLTLASSNLGTLEIKDNQLVLGCSLRSPSLAMLNELKAQVSMIVEMVGADVNFYAQYPGWNYVVNSPLRQVLFDVYEQLYAGDKMEIEAVHGGLELGIFADRLLKADIISIGPIMYDIHTPNERLNIDSFKRVYNLLIAVLAQL